MSTNTLGLFLRHLALSEEVGRLGTASDRDLLAAYELGRGQAAFTELMRRHGPMVLRTCRRVLGRSPDAEDAFQATFVLLARRAGPLRREVAGPLSLGGWLHRVAYRTAVNVLIDVTRRRTHERQAGAMTHLEPDPLREATWNEIKPILDAELDALPEESRRLLIACYLQEKTHAEAAAELGIALGSLARRLEKARTLLADRLARRGILVSASLLAVLLGEAASGAGVPAVLLVHTVEAARTFAEQASGIVSANVARLVKGGLAHVAKGSTRLSVALAGWLGLLGAGLIACQTLKAWPDKTPDREPPTAPAAERPAQERDKQARTDLAGDPLPPGALTRLGTTRLRHNIWVQTLVFTPDSKRLITAGGDNLPRLWEVSTGKLLREFTNIPKPQIRGSGYHQVFGAVLSPDGRILATRSGPMGNLYLLETATGKLLHEFQGKREDGSGNSPSLNFVFSPDGETIAAQLVGRLELREVATGRERWAREEEQTFSGLAFSPDGKTLASGGRDGIHLWDARTGKPLRPLGHKWPVNRLAFSPNGRTLVVGYEPSKDREHSSAYLWDVATGKEVRQLGEPDNANVVFAAFSPDGKMIVTAGSGGIRLWEAATGKELHRCSDGYVCEGPLAFSPDGKLLAAMVGPMLRFWEVASGKALPSRLPKGHERGITAVAFTPDGQTLVSAAATQTVCWWDTRTGQQRQNLSFKTNPLLRCFDYPTKAALSPDGTLLAVSCFDMPDGEGRPEEVLKGLRGSIRFLVAATGKELRRLDSEKGSPNQLTFSPDGKWLAEGFWTTAGLPVVQLWEVATGKRQERAFGGRMPVFSPNSNILATVEGERDNTISFWQVATGKKIHSLSTKEYIQCLALSPDGQLMATSSDKITLYSLSWDKSSGVQVGTSRLVAYPPHWAVCNLAFSPDSKMLASSGSDHTVHVWETASGKERTRFHGHNIGATDMTSGVAPLSFTADGRRLASGGADSTILIWDVTGRLQDGDRRPAKLSEKELEALWADLEEADAARAGRTVWALVAAGPQTVSLLGKRLRPTVATVSPEVVARLIADLDSEDFASRQKARGELKKLGEACEPSLRQALAKQPSVEMRRSLQELLSQLEEIRKEPSGDVLRILRAVEVLEQVGTPDARRVLEGLTRGVPGERLTREAQAALGRLNRR
ncbi:MAG TPA: sigma-70 family RNA polymerase sigma factor [Gemmataceae bacterium]